MALTIGVDIGGTKIAAGVVDEHGTIVECLRRPTPIGDADKVVQIIGEMVRELGERHEVEAVGLGAAGFVDETRSMVRFAPNLAWEDEPLQRRVAELVGLPVVVENDANAMAWGEYRFGAGRGESHVVCVTVGTGIGGGFVFDGRLYRGRWGAGAELGHMQVVPEGRPCGCGNLGCWEQYGSGTALVHEARAAATADPSRAAALLERVGGAADAISGLDVAAAAKAGDEAALAAFTAIGRWLGQGLADLAAVLDPGCFVIGGGVAGAAEFFLDTLRETFAGALSGRGHRPVARIRPAELGPSAGLIGAADLARLL